MESRLKKSLSVGGRQTRASEDEVRQPPEEKFISSQERRKMWADEWTQSALPKTPHDPRWHFCWLSTTNGYDSIDKRLRLGYVPVRADEYPGYENYKVKAGEHVGFIACNEMLLHKLPMDIYQDVMLQMHHEAPNEEADKIRVQAENVVNSQRDSNGKPLGKLEGEGFGNLDRQVPIPVFHG